MDTPEYDLGRGTATQAERELSKMSRDPGIPDELVEEISREPRDLATINTELIGELMPFAASVMVTILFVELIKGLGLRPFLRGLQWPEGRRELAYRWCVAGTACATSFTFGFHEAILNLTGVSLSILEDVLYGTATVALAAHLAYQMRLVQVVKVKVYGWIGIEEGDLLTDSEAEAEDLFWTQEEIDAAKENAAELYDELFGEEVD